MEAKSVSQNWTPETNTENFIEQIEIEEVKSISTEERSEMKGETHAEKSQKLNTIDGKDNLKPIEIPESISSLLRQTPNTLANEKTAGELFTNNELVNIRDGSKSYSIDK